MFKLMFVLGPAVTMLMSVSQFAQARSAKWEPVQCPVHTGYEKVAPRTWQLRVKQIGETQNFDIQVVDTRFPKAVPLLQDIARLSIEDVNADFNGSRSSLRIFLDEWDQTYLVIKRNNQAVHFDCQKYSN
jgi:hypothetical protein